MRVAILVDGAFLRVKHRQAHYKRYPTAEFVYDLCVNRIMNSEKLAGDSLFRVYYYDCRPFSGTLRNPITSEDIDYTISTSFLESVAQKDMFLVRAGEIKFGGWRLSDDSLKRIIDAGRTITGEDLQPSFQQKQVDMKIGLDIAWLSLKGIVDKIVLVTGDSDFIPAMEFARREGVLVYLVNLETYVKPGMLESVDGVIKVTPSLRGFQMGIPTQEPD